VLNYVNKIIAKLTKKMLCLKTQKAQQNILTIHLGNP